MSLLEARGLGVSARVGDGDVPVLRDLDFSLAPGRILGLVGESGAGKSMIGKAIAQLLPHRFRISAGSLSFCGESLIGIPARRRRALLGKDIAFIPQEPLTALNPVLSIGRQLDEHLARLGVAGAGARRVRAIAALAGAHLPEPERLLAKYPHQLSGGMCQRVLIATAFAGGPKLVVADEPTTALDVTIQARIMRLILEEKERLGTAVLLITHDLKLAAQMCDDILVLYAGRAVEAGPARAVFAQPAHPYTRCLQLANPPLKGPRRALLTLPEHMPGLATLATLSGCRFAPRCPVKGPDCDRLEPGFDRVAEGHLVACPRLAEARAIAAPTVPAEAAAPRAPVVQRRPLVEVCDLWKRYPAGHGWFHRHDQVAALKGVSFELFADEFVGVVGESGSGKSTLAKVVMGLEAPSDGTVLVGGHDVRDPIPAARAARIETVQMVFQDPQSALNPRRRVAGIVTQAMEAGRHRAGWPERLARAQELLAEIRMPPDTASRYPGQLSGGQRQRVNIARALCTTPKVLVADEIVSGLDVSVQAQILTLLLALKRDLSIGMLFISHDLSVVRALCDRVLVMVHGQVVESGPVDQVFEQPAHPYTRALLDAVPPDHAGAAWAPLIEEAIS